MSNGKESENKHNERDRGNTNPITHRPASPNIDMVVDHSITASRHHITNLTPRTAFCALAQIRIHASIHSTTYGSGAAQQTGGYRKAIPSPTLTRSLAKSMAAAKDNPK
jgi:hypothetical protein